MRPIIACVTLALCSVGTAAAQTSASTSEPSVQWQVAAAVLPLAEASRASATVMGYRNGKLAVLRKGTGHVICLGDNPATNGFQVSCYHDSLEPFMARGRSLRALGITEREAVDSVRRAEVRTGALAMPSVPAALNSIFADSSRFDPAAGPPKDSGFLDVIYMPYATGESTGISERPQDGRPWLMFPGEPWAHVMISR